MIDIYKISSDELTEPESEHGVIRIEPIMSGGLDAATYLASIIDRYNGYGKLSSPTELGCALFHSTIHQEIVNNNCTAIILESNISPTENQIRAVLDKYEIISVDFIHLRWHPFIEKRVFFKGKYLKLIDFRRIKPYEDFHGAYAYFLNLTIASKLLSFHKQSIQLADSWAVFFHKYPVNPYLWPLFSHPSDRGDLEAEHVAISPLVYSLRFQNIAFYASKHISKFFQKYL